MTYIEALDKIKEIQKYTNQIMKPFDLPVRDCITLANNVEEYNKFVAKGNVGTQFPGGFTLLVRFKVVEVDRNNKTYLSNFDKSCSYERFINENNLNISI